MPTSKIRSDSFYGFRPCVSDRDSHGNTLRCGMLAQTTSEQDRLLNGDQVFVDIKPVVDEVRDVEALANRMLLRALANEMDVRWRNRTSRTGYEASDAQPLARQRSNLRTRLRDDVHTVVKHLQKLTHCLEAPRNHRGIHGAEAEEGRVIAFGHAVDEYTADVNPDGNRPAGEISVRRHSLFLPFELSQFRIACNGDI